jgi:hypothetical protein
MVAPMYCVTIDDARWLRLGVFTTAQAARAAADAYLAQATRLRPPTTGVERVYVSRRPR